ncbi:hypothetical protein [Pseudonocardia sp. HH130630-07]|uniref:hypothetical protein n=1 Tax=Pseudonocardia sp. HH130630-07 TaxID=1690815 RepID=UPI001E56201A|nr:hypothetical protein [Pseudonocardia sp. HH130630-07]
MARLVDNEDWRTDKRHAWTAMLHRIIWHMDWDTGLITGLPHTQIAAAADRATRTVSRLIAWARQAGLLVVVEPGANADFLATTTNRTPTYALVIHAPAPLLTPATATLIDTAGHTPVEETGDLSQRSVGLQPLSATERRRLTIHSSWHFYDVPDTPGDRRAATRTFIALLGLGGRQRSKIELWRACAMLKPHWDAGATISGLRHALEHHPDHGPTRRGPVTTNAHDPLRIIGWRLRPWTNRHHEIRANQIGQLRRTTPTATPRPAASAALGSAPVVILDRVLLDRPAGRAGAAAAREALSEHLRQLRETRHHHRPATTSARRLRRIRVRRPSI